MQLDKLQGNKEMIWSNKKKFTDLGRTQQLSTNFDHSNHSAIKSQALQGGTAINISDIK